MKGLRAEGRRRSLRAVAFSNAAVVAEPKRRVPGEEGVWVLVFGDLMVFGVFFLAFAHAHGDAQQMFADGHRLLDRRLGLLNTFLLLTSSLFVAHGVHRARDPRGGANTRFTLAMLCGLGFVGIKAIEYGQKFSHGITPLTNDFFMYYFVFTGIHLLHVLIGLAVLAWIRCSVSDEPVPVERMLLIESGGIFWHLVDLLWIVLFALFYILGS